MLSSGLGGSYVPTASAALGEAIHDNIPDAPYFGEVTEPFAPPKPREPKDLPPPAHVYKAREKMNLKRRAKSERQHWINSAVNTLLTLEPDESVIDEEVKHHEEASGKPKVGAAILTSLDMEGWEEESADSDNGEAEEDDIKRREKIGPGFYGLEFDIEDEHDLGENHKLHLLLEAQRKKEEEQLKTEIEEEINEQDYYKQLTRSSINLVSPLMNNLNNINEAIVESLDDNEEGEVLFDEYGFKKTLLTSKQKEEQEFILRMCEDKPLVLNAEDQLMRENLEEIENNKLLLSKQKEKEIKIKLKLDSVDNSSSLVNHAISSILPADVNDAYKSMNLLENESEVEEKRAKLIKISKREKRRRMKIEALLAAKKDIEEREQKVRNLESKEMREHKRLARMARLGMLQPKLEELEDTTSESSDISDDERLHFEEGMRVEVNKPGRGWVVGTIVQLTAESIALRDALLLEEQKRLTAEATRVAAESARQSVENAKIAAAQARQSATEMANTLSVLSEHLPHLDSTEGKGPDGHAEATTEEEAGAHEEKSSKQTNKLLSREERRELKKARDMSRRARKRRRRLLLMQRPYVLLDGYKHPFQFDEVRMSRQREGGLKPEDCFGIVSKSSKPLYTVMLPEFPTTSNGYIVYTNEKFVYNRVKAVKHTPVGHGGEIYTVMFYDLSNGRGWLHDFNNEKPHLKNCISLEHSDDLKEEKSTNEDQAYADSSTTSVRKLNASKSGLTSLFNGQFSEFYSSVMDNMTGMSKVKRRAINKDINLKDSEVADSEAIERASQNQENELKMKEKLSKMNIGNKTLMATNMIKLQREEAKQRQNAALKMLSQEKEVLKKSKNSFISRTVKRRESEDSRVVEKKKISPVYLGRLNALRNKYGPVLYQDVIWWKDKGTKEYEEFMEQLAQEEESIIKLAQEVASLKSKAESWFATSEDKEKARQIEEEYEGLLKIRKHQVRVRFDPRIRVIHIPSWRILKPHVISQLWTISNEMKLQKKRNLVEFEFEEFNFDKVLEDEHFLVHGGEKIHPVHVMSEKLHSESVHLNKLLKSEHDELSNLKKLVNELVVIPGKKHEEMYKKKQSKGLKSGKVNEPGKEEGEKDGKEEGEKGEGDEDDEKDDEEKDDEDEGGDIWSLSKKMSLPTLGLSKLASNATSVLKEARKKIKGQKEDRKEEELPVQSRVNVSGDSLTEMPLAYWEGRYANKDDALIKNSDPYDISKTNVKNMKRLNRRKLAESGLITGEDEKYHQMSIVHQDDDLENTDDAKYNHLKDIFETPDGQDKDDEHNYSDDDEEFDNFMNENIKILNKKGLRDHMKKEDEFNQTLQLNETGGYSDQGHGEHILNMNGDIFFEADRQQTLNKVNKMNKDKIVKDTVENQARTRRSNRRTSALNGATIKSTSVQIEEMQQQEIKKRLTKLNVNVNETSQPVSGGKKKKKATNYSHSNVLSSESKDMLLLSTKDAASIVKASTLIDLANHERRTAKQERIKNEHELKELRQLVELLNAPPTEDQVEKS